MIDIDRFETIVVMKTIDLREDPLRAILIFRDDRLDEIQITRNPVIGQLGDLVDHGPQQWKKLLEKIVGEISG